MSTTTGETSCPRQRGVSSYSSVTELGRFLFAILTGTQTTTAMTSTRIRKLHTVAATGTPMSRTLRPYPDGDASVRRVVVLLDADLVRCPGASLLQAQ